MFALPGAGLEAARDFAERIRCKVGSYPWEKLETRSGISIRTGVAHVRSDNWRAVLASAIPMFVALDLVQRLV